MIHTVLVSPFFKKEKLYYFFLMHRDVCRLLVLQLGIEPKPLAVKALSVKHWIAREFPRSLL